MVKVANFRSKVAKGDEFKTWRPWRSCSSRDHLAQFSRPLHRPTAIDDQHLPGRECGCRCKVDDGIRDVVGCRSACERGLFEKLRDLCFAAFEPPCQNWAWSDRVHTNVWPEGPRQ